MRDVTSSVHERRDFLHFIGNRFVPSHRSGISTSVRRWTAAWSAPVAEGGRDEVHAAVQAARAALSGPWGRLTLPQRTDMLHGVAREIDRRFDDFLDAEVHDTGKPRSIASHVDIPRGAANFASSPMPSRMCPPNSSK